MTTAKVATVVTVATTTARPNSQWGLNGPLTILILTFFHIPNPFDEGASTYPQPPPFLGRASNLSSVAIGVMAPLIGP